MKTDCEFYWWIDTSGNLRIEHISTIKSGNPLDLTTAEYQQYLENRAQFTYENIENITNEEWEIPDAYYDDFEGLPITYSGSCVDFGEGPKSESKTSIFVTDFLAVAHQKEDFGGGKMLLHFDYFPLGDGVLQTPGAISAVQRYNGAFAIAKAWENKKRAYLFTYLFIAC